MGPFIEISLDNLVHNLAEVRQRLPVGVGVMAVVKDQAYGCGAIAVARCLEAENVGFFAVARIEEARGLREGGISVPILVLGECDTEAIRWGAGQGVRFSVNDLASLDRFAVADVPVVLHCKFDTGMTRMGIACDDVPVLAEFLRANQRLELEGAFMHMACADVPGTPTIQRQLDRFADALKHLSDAGLSPVHVHCANSATIFRFGPWQSTLVRPGISLYGCRPDPAQDFGVDLRPVASLKGQVVRVRRVPAGTAVSYGGTYVTASETNVATVNVGYAHGLPRALSGTGEALVGGRRYRIAGRVTMDFVMLDVGLSTGIITGDEVVVLGSQGGERISPDDVAFACGTIGYEVLCGLSAALDRRYLRAGVVEDVRVGCQY